MALSAMGIALPQVSSAIINVTYMEPSFGLYGEGGCAGDANAGIAGIHCPCPSSEDPGSVGDCVALDSTAQYYDWFNTYEPPDNPT